MKKIKNYLFDALIILVPGLVWIYTLYLSATGKIIGPMAFLGPAGWLTLMLVIFSSNSVINKALKKNATNIRKYEEFLKYTDKAIHRAYGYNKKLDKNVAIYSKIALSNSIAVANELAEFLLHTKDSDTTLVIRVEHDQETWFFHICGKVIHVDMLIAILDMAKDRAYEISGEEEIIYRKNYNEDRGN